MPPGYKEIEHVKCCRTCKWHEMIEMGKGMSKYSRMFKCKKYGLHISPLEIYERICKSFDFYPEEQFITDIGETE